MIKVEKKNEEDTYCNPRLPCDVEMIILKCVDDEILIVITVTTNHVLAYISEVLKNISEPYAQVAFLGTFLFCFFVLF